MNRLVVHSLYEFMYHCVCTGFCCFEQCCFWPFPRPQLETSTRSPGLQTARLDSIWLQSPAHWTVEMCIGSSCLCTSLEVTPATLATLFLSSDHELWCMTLTFELDLNSVNLNQCATYLWSKTTQFKSYCPHTCGQFDVAVRLRCAHQRSYAVLGPVSVGIVDHLRMSKPPWYVSSQLGQLSLIPSVGWEMSTGQNAVTLCSWGVKAGMAHSISWCTCGWHCVIPG